MGDRRIYRVYEHVFRVSVDEPHKAAEVFQNGRWEPVTLTTEEVLSLVDVAEVSPQEGRELGLPD